VYRGSSYKLQPDRTALCLLFEKHTTKPSSIIAPCATSLLFWFLHFKLGIDVSGIRSV